MDSILQDRLRNRNQRELVVSSVMEGFAGLRKKPVDDLDRRTKSMEARIRNLAEDVRIGFVNGRLVVKVSGSSESLMNELRRGSDWYAPWDEIDGIVLAAVLIDPSK